MPTVLKLSSERQFWILQDIWSKMNPRCISTALHSSIWKLSTIPMTQKCEETKGSAEQIRISFGTHTTWVVHWRTRNDRSVDASCEALRRRKFRQHWCKNRIEDKELGLKREKAQMANYTIQRVMIKLEVQDMSAAIVKKSIADDWAHMVTMLLGELLISVLHVE